MHVPETDYMDEKIYFLALYVGPFGAYLMTQVVTIYQNNCWNMAINLPNLQSGQKNINFGQKRHQRKKSINKLV